MELLTVKKIKKKRKEIEISSGQGYVFLDGITIENKSEKDISVIIFEHE